LASRDNVPALCIDVDFNHVQSSFVGDDPIDWVHVEVSERQHRIGQLRFNESAHLEDLRRHVVDSSLLPVNCDSAHPKHAVFVRFQLQDLINEAGIVRGDADVQAGGSNSRCSSAFANRYGTGCPEWDSGSASTGSNCHVM
jgi:hypothetical protein